MKYEYKVILGLIIAAGVLGWVGHMDYETARLEKASNYCQAVDTAFFHECVANQLK